MSEGAGGVCSLDATREVAAAGRVPAVPMLLGDDLRLLTAFLGTYGGGGSVEVERDQPPLLPSSPLGWHLLGRAKVRKGTDKRLQFLALTSADWHTSRSYCSYQSEGGIAWVCSTSSRRP